jgi:8-oxo-dGTP pyrophosphatase MutT (NUDIX family)
VPLLSGKSEIGHNIREMEKAGHPHKQAVAAALHKAYDAHAAGVLLRTKDNRALFMRRAQGDHAGTWAFPAGKIEDGETPEQAARRETEEETGHLGNDPLVQIDQGDFVTFREDVEEFEPRLNEEHTEYRWAPMDAPPEPLHPGVKSTLGKLLADAHALDTENWGALDRRDYDSNDWFTVEDNPLSKVGVYQYSEASVIRGGDPKKLVGVYRPAEELGSRECIDSFKLMPWTDDHPSTLLGPEDQGLVPAEKKGVHGVIGEKVYFRGDTLYGNVKVFSESLAKKIAAGKRELSCGYHCDFIPQEGVYEGAPYKYVQRNMRGNHLSSVYRGRMGSEVRVLDAADAAANEFATGARFTFSLDMRDPEMGKREDEMKDCLDSETEKFIREFAEDFFNSLVSELEKRGYSKEYATKVAGKVAAEKGMTGHHDSSDKVPHMTATAVDSKGDVKDPEGKEDPSKKDDLKPGDAKDAKSARDARDSKRSARDARRARDMTAEEEEAEDAAECAEDAEEEKEDEKDESKEARDRRSARDRRAGARDARARVRDRAKDSKKGMDAAAVAALVKQEVATTALDAAQVAALVRKDETAKHRLYQRLSPIVGAFDASEMSHADMAAYGLKKVGQPESKDPVTALDYFLAGRSQRGEPQGAAHDSASKGESFVDKYVA